MFFDDRVAATEVPMSADVDTDVLIARVGAGSVAGCGAVFCAVSGTGPVKPAPPTETEPNYEPSTYPGFFPPDVWAGNTAKKYSTHDLGRNFGALRRTSPFLSGPISTSAGGRSGLPADPERP
ncbi:hypothetical protein QFZ30_002212 [Arthrobacter pascens]|nr:hypothetical protein [Arthrobacter pascens]